MSTVNNNALQQFKNLVGIKFQLYNSLFTSLPFHRIEKTGILVSLLLLNCEEGYLKNKSPQEIIEEFFFKQTAFTKEEEKIDLLFAFVQYIERQVVLFDALEDAASKEIIDLGGVGSLNQLLLEAKTQHREEELCEKLKDFTVQLVLTAHPTQFYRDEVLGIIHDLSTAINTNNELQIYAYLRQLGRTPFFQKQKPTPYDEAISLIWYLENIFYPASGKIVTYLKTNLGKFNNSENSIIRMGFWPGGDRDGNPYVHAATTVKVAHALRSAAIKCYYQDVSNLKRRLTFKGVDTALAKLENELFNHLFVPNHIFKLSKQEILQALQNIRYQLIGEHAGLFTELVESLINKVEIFGLHFASIDIRQEASIHGKTIATLAEHAIALPQNYSSLHPNEKISVLTNLNDSVDTHIFVDEVQKDVLDVMAAMQLIQQCNGETGCNRYIISQCNTALNVMEVYGLFLLSGWKKEELSVDIVPLFETVDDLQAAAVTMQALYENETYQQHLHRRNKKQTIMLGFSDGTKDGGYLMANWSIYKAKESLTAISKKYDIDVVFFDGRGGPPSRGGGKTHNFYASLGKNISSKEIQLTIQGQTISSNFGTIDAAQYNIEQLLHAGISNNMFAEKEILLSEKEEHLIQSLAEEGHKAYILLKEHPNFIGYLLHASPLRFYSETNIGSRPAKRGKSTTLELKDLRAIPFVGAWSQLKQNVTGYYGVGIALEKLANAGYWNEIKQMYRNSLFFKTLIDNCEMSMKKCCFPLTAFLSKHPQYGGIWNMIYEEYERTKNYVLLLSESDTLMANYPVDQLSIQMRERIVLPLLTIQQYAITQVRDIEEQQINTPTKEVYEKLAMRCSFGIINAGRNSA